MTYRESAIVESLDDEQASANAWTTIERALGRSPLWPNGNPRRVTNLGPRGKGVAYPFDFASKDELKLLMAAAQDADLTDSLEPDGVLLALPGTFGSNRRFVSGRRLASRSTAPPPSDPSVSPLGSPGRCSRPKRTRSAPTPGRAPRWSRPGCAPCRGPSMFA